MKKLLFAVLVICLAFSANVFAEEFSADMTTVAAGMTTPSKVYYKDYKTSRNETKGMVEMVAIQNGDNVYQIFESTKKYFAMDLNALKQQNPMADADNFQEFIEKNGIKKVGSETVAEYKCDVYEGNVTYEQGQAPIAMKLWYSPKLDYAVKTEIQLSAPMAMTAVSTLSNIKIGKQPDSLFELPAGYTQVQSIQEAMGMGGF